MKRKRSDLDDALEQENALLRSQIAVKNEEIGRLEKQLEVAEARSSRIFPGGESFSEAGATPHLLSRALERVFTISGSFTKLVMQSLKSRGYDCTAEAKTMARFVVFERDAHTKFFYQALICKVLFSDFEHEHFNVQGNAPETILDPEELSKANFERYKELSTLENPESLVFEDAPENDFRRLTIAKHKALVAAFGALHMDAVSVFGESFGPVGIRRRESAALGGAATRLATSFAKAVLSVLVAHKLAFALCPVARIMRVREMMRFTDRYMEPVVSSSAADSGDGEHDDPGVDSSLVGFMVVPGFLIHRIVVRSRVYTVKESS